MDEIADIKERLKKAEEERDGYKVRLCCDEAPECSHALASYEAEEAKARAAKLEKAIEDAPHANRCSFSRVGRYPCDCWKAAAALGEEP
jgi:hypothetical protein